MNEHLSRDFVLQSIQRFYHYLNSQVVTIEKNGHRYSGFVLDISKTKATGRIGIGSTALGLSMYSLISEGNEQRISEMEQFIISRQLANGSWTISSLARVGVSLVYTTCYALQALARSNFAKNITYIEKGVNWLLQVVNDDGGWGLYPNSESHIHSTAEVLYSFSLLESPVNQKVFTKAKEWLLQQRVGSYWVDEDGHPSLFLTALAYKGLLSNGNFHHSLEETRNWLIHQLGRAPCREETIYFIRTGSQYLQEPISCFTRSLMFEALLSDIYFEYDRAVEREGKYVLKLQDPLGFWRCSESPTQVPVFLNHYVCMGLLKYASYLDRKPPYVLLSKTKELFKYNPLVFLGFLLFFGIGVIHSARRASVAFDSLGQVIARVNEYFESLSGIANLFQITGISAIAALVLVIRFLSKRAK